MSIPSVCRTGVWCGRERESEESRRQNRQTKLAQLDQWQTEREFPFCRLMVNQRPCFDSAFRSSYSLCIAYHFPSETTAPTSTSLGPPRHPKVNLVQMVANQMISYDNFRRNDLSAMRTNKRCFRSCHLEYGCKAERGMWAPYFTEGERAAELNLT